MSTQKLPVLTPIYKKYYSNQQRNQLLPDATTLPHIIVNIRNTGI